MDSDDMLIELGYSWLVTKAILVACFIKFVFEWTVLGIVKYKFNL